MPFVKTPGEGTINVSAEVSVEDLIGEKAKAVTEKLEKAAAVVEKAVTEKLEEAAAVVEEARQAVETAKALSEGGLEALGERALGAVTAKVTQAIEDKIEEVVGKIPGVNVNVDITAGKLPGGGIATTGGIVAGKLPGILAEPDLPIFEERAITSSIPRPQPNFFVKPGSVVAEVAGALERLEGGKILEVEVASGDALDVRNFSIQERLSSLFQVNLVAVSDNPSIDFDAVVGQPARFLMHAGAHSRLWSGLCNHLEQVRVEAGGLSTYQISIVPTLWLLTQRKNHRMFQHASELEIALKLLKDWDIEPEERFDRGAYKKRKYRVQYAETDFAFLSRMLEDAGITYLFEQVKTKEGEETKLVLADAPQANPRREGLLTFLDDTTMVQKHKVEFATHVRMGKRVRPGKYTLRDHDYRRPPSYKLMASAKGGQGIEEKLERYQYTPGAFLFGTDQGESTPVADDKGKTRTDEKEAAKVAQKRLDAKRGSAKVCTFETNAYDVGPGSVLGIEGHPNEALDESKSLLVVESSLSGTSHGEWSHHCEARGTEVPFRPELSTEKPKVNGVESATVVGRAGEEIHTDEFGRVRVHFHWDRESKMDDGSSCWIPVSQSWGGAGFGGMNLPRVGQEVLVDFLGGDPDRPVVVGRVYTNLQKVPYKLPQNKTQSGWRSNSTGGGGGYNEVMFEDAHGEERVNIQAERDLNELVKHNASVTVKNDRTMTVWKKDSSLVGTEHKLTIALPGKEAPAPGPTSVTMTHTKITLDTGESSITLDGGKITLKGVDIELKAFGKIDVGSVEDTKISAKKVVHIDGDEAVLINCTKPPPKPIDEGGPSAMSILGMVALGVGVAAAVISAPVVAGVVIGAAVVYGTMSH